MFRPQFGLLTLGLITLLPQTALAAEPAAAPPPALPWWSAAPFVLLLLAIAVLPLVAEHWWEKNRNKALISILVALPVGLYLYSLGPLAIDLLVHELQQYLSFIILLASLYTVSGGIVLRGDLQGKPSTNLLFLALGAVLANVIGTTGASMLLIRPVLRINSQRQNRGHIPIFFIFIVSNLGGLLTPLGDPPLFLGFLNGVPFVWTFNLWVHWLVVNAILLVVFFVWDTIAFSYEKEEVIRRDIREVQPLRLSGLINLVFLAGILLAVLLQARGVADALQGAANRLIPCPPLLLEFPVPEAIMAAMAFLSWLVTPRVTRQANQFTWGPILEVAILFFGIFVAMVPALAVIKANSAAFGLKEPWEFFWVTGSLSSFLDNAPTYMVFATVAGAEHPDFALPLPGFRLLVENQVAGIDGPAVLAAISCGAVFMGANTYIGNGPNFMVKAIAERSGYRMPSFLGYMLYSGLILLPIFGVITYVFFV